MGLYIIVYDGIIVYGGIRYEYQIKEIFDIVEYIFFVWKEVSDMSMTLKKLKKGESNIE